MIKVFPQRNPREAKIPWHLARGLALVIRKENDYANEETNTPFGDGISDRLVGPVKTGKPSL